MNTIELIDRLEQEKSLQKEEWITLVESASEENREYAAHKGADTRRPILWERNICAWFDRIHELLQK